MPEISGSVARESWPGEGFASKRTVRTDIVPFVQEFRAMSEERKRKMSIAEIEAVALKLPTEQREELLARLIAHRRQQEILRHTRETV